MSDIITYITASIPSPLEAGRSGTVSFAVVPIVTGAYCKQITLSIPCGTGDGALFSLDKGNPDIVTNDEAWHSLGLKRGGKKNSRGDDIEPLTFELTCDDPGKWKLVYDLAFTLSGYIAASPGSAVITVVALCSNDGNDYANSPEVDLVFQKSNAQFYLKNFAVASPDRPTIPCTEFAQGDPIMFSWESNGRWFRLYRGEESTPVYSGRDTTYTMSEGLASDTTVFLQASLIDAVMVKREKGSITPVYLYDKVSVFISNADRIFNQVTINNALRGAGNFLMSGARRSLTPADPGEYKSYNATTDGIVNAKIGSLPQGAAGLVKISQDGFDAVLYGFSSSKDNLTVDYLSTSMYVKANTDFEIHTTLAANVYFSWIPLGGGEITHERTCKLAEEK
jgi:hypothetical protein